jgi:hypothetical protein
MTLQQIIDMKDGPAKKFYLIKFYGDELRKATKTDITKLGCQTLLALLGAGSK